MALNFQRGVQDFGGLTVGDVSTTPMVLGTLVTYAQATNSISVGANVTYNAVSVGNAFGVEGRRKVTIEVPSYNKEYWIVAGGTIAIGDRIGSNASGYAVKDATNAAVLTAMSAGVAGQVIVCQKKL